MAAGSIAGTASTTEPSARLIGTGFRRRRDSADEPSLILSRFGRAGWRIDAAEAIFGFVPIRHLLFLFAALALVVAPFGRMGAAEAMPNHSPGAMAGHCDDMAPPDDGSADKAAIDCMIACATLAAAVSPLVDIPQPEITAPLAQAVRAFAGIDLQAEPPPPRLS